MRNISIINDDVIRADLTKEEVVLDILGAIRTTSTLLDIVRELIYAIEQEKIQPRACDDLAKLRAIQLEAEAQLVKEYESLDIVKKIVKEEP